MRLVSVRLIAALSLLLPAAATAQVAGLPVYNSGVGRLIGLRAEGGFPNDAAGGGTTFGATGLVGLGPIGASATIARVNPSGNDNAYTSYGGTVSFKVFGAPFVPLSITLQGGAASAKLGTNQVTGAAIRETRVPVGVGFALRLATPVVTVKPWIAPRVQYLKVTGAGDQTKFGLSGGLEFDFVNGVGVHAAYDRIFVDGDPGVFGVGLHYGIRVPGL